MKQIADILQAVIAAIPTDETAKYAKEPRPDLASYIDHTLLKPESVPEQVDTICVEAIEHKFASVCIQPRFVNQSFHKLKSSDVKVCTVIGFPLGANSTQTKAFETKQALVDGADEIDMVIPVGDLKAGNYAAVYDDIRAVVVAADSKLVKVIIETALLNDDEKIAACILSQRAGAHYVKTSTGFSSGGATAEDIALMRKTVGPDMGVKASGGIRDTGTAKAMIDAGATRLGVSAGIAIVKGENAGSGDY